MSVLLHWVILFGFWLVLSGMFDPLHLVSGVCCTGAVAWLSRDLQMLALPRSERREMHLAQAPWLRLLRYSGWLLKEIALANWQVMRIVLDPKLPIDPGLVRFRTALETDLGVTLFANSITLTPGTITVEVAEHEFVVHALVADEPMVAGLTAMEKQVAASLVEIEGSMGPTS